MDTVAEELSLIGKLKEELNLLKERNIKGDLSRALDLVDELESDIKNRCSSHLITDELRFILDKIDEAVYVKDTKSCFIYANNKFLKIVEVDSFGEIEGKTDDDLNWGNLERDRFKYMSKICIQNKASVKNVIGPVKRSNGQHYWFECRKSPVINAQGKVEAVFGILDDVTNSRKKQQALLHSEARLKNYFLNTNDGLFILNYKFEIIDVNPAIFQITGYKRDELLKRNLFDLFIDNESLDGLKEKCKNIGINTESHECSLISLDNKLKHVKLDILNVEIDHYICFVKDISDLKRAIKKAEESNRLKTAFLQNISHELRTPLNAIIGFSNILVRKMYDTEKDADAYKKVIYNNSEYLLGLINNVIDLSKIETGQTDLNPSKFVLVPFIKNDVLPVIIAEKERLNKDKVIIDLDVSDLSERVGLYADQGRLKQIIVNLMHNALKFTIEGKVSLKISEAGDCLLFEVADTGIGINNEQLGRIFHRFYKVQGEGVVTPFPNQGSGLGLAIVKKLLNLMNGRIKVESEINKGTRFIFEIPKQYEPAR